jgi:hypothetical protein
MFTDLSRFAGWGIGLAFGFRFINRVPEGYRLIAALGFLSTGSMMYAGSQLLTSTGVPEEGGVESYGYSGMIGAGIGSLARLGYDWYIGTPQENTGTQENTANNQDQSSANRNQMTP